MKITIISPNESHLQEMGRLLELNHHIPGRGNAHDATLYERIGRGDK